MAIPRWMHRVYAWINGYFWIPCPLCGRMFGGHEWSDHASIKMGGGLGKGVCQLCVDHAHAINYARSGSVELDVDGVRWSVSDSLISTLEHEMQPSFEQRREHLKSICAEYGIEITHTPGDNTNG